MAITTHQTLAGIRSLIERGVRAAAECERKGRMGAQGAWHEKGRQERKMDQLRLDVICEILDRDFQYHGEWGQTAFGIRMELMRRAQEQNK